MTIQSAAAVTAAAAVKLDGSSAGVGANGLTIAAGVDAVTMSQPGSVIRNFRSIGLRLSGGTLGSTFGGFTIANNGIPGRVRQPRRLHRHESRRYGHHGQQGQRHILNGAVQSLAVGTTSITSNGGNGIVFNGSATGVTIDDTDRVEEHAQRTADIARGSGCGWARDHRFGLHPERPAWRDPRQHHRRGDRRHDSFPERAGAGCC